jgi:hypothetical protein
VCGLGIKELNFYEKNKTAKEQGYNPWVQE